MINCEKFVLSNGLRTYITPMPSMPTKIVLVLVKGGSRLETREKNGIAHFMEHMFFKGGQKYPDFMSLGSVSDAFGAHLNAYTTKEIVGYYVEHGVSAGNLAFDILEDMLMHASFPEEAINNERSIILGELRGAMDEDEEVLSDLVCEELLYGTHPLGRNILGTKDTLAQITREDLISYRDTYFKSGNMVICVVGNVNISDTKRELENRFSGIAHGPAIDFELFNPENRPRQRVSVLPKKEREQAYVVLVSPTGGYSHEDWYALNVLSVILGTGLSSRLFQSLREEKGLVYYIGMYGGSCFETGTLYSNWGVDHNAINISTEFVLDEYKKIRDEYVGIMELDKAKGYIIGSREIGFSNISTVAGNYGNFALLLGEPELFGVLREKVNAVTKEDILRVAQKYLCPENLKIAMAAEENFCDKEKLEEILENAN